MTLRARHEHRPNVFNLDDRVWVLEDGQGGCAEIAPALGFNCYRWAVPSQQVAGSAHELLYADPHFFQENRPTRSGFPILFPFPNRIRAGRFAWAGKEYHLPRIDPAGQNGIHGFACRGPWRVLGAGASDTDAWVTAEFQGSQDAPDTLALWPTDYLIRATYRLSAGRLTLHARIENPDTRPLPFGLGYHPYFRLDSFGGEDALVRVPARKSWTLEENLPTGEVKALDASHDLREFRRIQDLRLDDVLTDLEPSPASDNLVRLGEIRSVSGERRLHLLGSQAFRELVAFIPPHRQAICLEPYTCTTDAINLQQRGIDAGWRTLAPGAAWEGWIHLVVRL